jgi:aminopeptidase N
MRLLLILFAWPWLAAAAQAQVAADAHYVIRATVDPARSHLSADVTISIPAAQVEAENAFLLGAGYRLSRAEAGPHPVEVTATRQPWPGLQRITVRPRRPGVSAVTLRLRYAGPLGPSGDPPLNLITPELVELNLDSMWAPIRADLAARFTLDAEIRGVPQDLVAVAPGDVRRSGDRVIIRRRTPDVDAAFAAMRGLKAARTAGFEFYAADLESESARVYRRHGAAAQRFLEGLYGPTPGGPARVVMVRRARVSGYARPGYVVVTEGRGGAEVGQAKFVAHEFAHAWWMGGNSTTEDRWLSESTAEYAALRYVETAFGVAARDEMLASKRAAAAKAGPVLGAGRRTDAELYNKGPVLLFELEQRIGRERLDQAMAELARNPPKVTADFMRVLTRIAGEEAARTFEAAMRA